MSELAQTARKDARAKIDRMLRTDPKERVDASGYTPPDALEADVKTGPRPVSRRQFKRGGSAVSGLAAAERADRKPRKSGGNALATPDNLQNRDLKEANEERDGSKHLGGFKRGGHADAAEDKKLIKEMMHKEGCECGKCMGGRAKRAEGGPVAPKPLHYEIRDNHKQQVVGKAKNLTGATRMVDRRDNEYGAVRYSHRPVYAEGALENYRSQLAKSADQVKKAAGGSTTSGTKLDGTLQGTRPVGGRLARKHGGNTGKGKMNVNIIIATGAKDKPPMGAPMLPPGGMPPGLHQGAPPPPPGMPPQGMPPGGAMPPAPMPRRSGGRAGYDAGAGSGLGRLEKIKAYGHKA